MSEECPRFDKISKTLMTDSVTDSSTWIQEMLTLLKSWEDSEPKTLTMVIEKYMLTIGVRSVGGRPDITFAVIS